ncbi:MAG: glutamate-1-semialdehyde 2,1-aminomutase, partial [Candidatus Dormibacteria bacterium]
MERSHEAMARAARALPGGVNSPVRSFQAVGGTPPFFNRAEAQFLYDLDGNRYLDMVLAYGPLILGHLHPKVVAAVRGQLERGEAFGGPTEAEVELAEEIGRRMPSLEMLRLVSSGTEAAMSAVRLARGATGRDRILKFEGCYHGHSDALLAAAGSGVATLSIPGSPGVPAGTVADTVVLPFNDEEAVTALFSSSGSDIAAVIVEPVPANMGVVLPEPGFLEQLRRLTSQSGSLLIFDEVISGFRVGPGGAQGLFGVIPDLTCLGKVIGGGLPMAAFGGRRDLMSQLAPQGSVYQAGTLSGSPLAVAAGLATLRELGDLEPYQSLEALGAELEAGLRDVARVRGRALQVNRLGSMLTVYFADEPVTDYRLAKDCDREAFATVHH